ncbi:MAG: hypothetical protein PHC64_06640 [Candidatus Gastranaerophilales bacterium]|nr:hypothetical protein [Candidatus Gastranaerophilales bacterium]
MITEEQENVILSPQEVRDILRTDNREIVKLCKKASIVPKKDRNGQTYFSYNEVQNLKSLKESAKSTALTQADSQKVVGNLLETLESMEKSITDSMSKIIDEKLDGMDEVVVELIRCKTENETLRQKINELNKENYHLKSTVKSYKSVGLGFYVKKQIDDFSI